MKNLILMALVLTLALAAVTKEKKEAELREKEILRLRGLLLTPCNHRATGKCPVCGTDLEGLPLTRKPL